MIRKLPADRSPRWSMDLQALNKLTSREGHHMASPINLVSRVPKGMLKTVLDCWNDFHSITLTTDETCYVFNDVILNIRKKEVYFVLMITITLTGNKMMTLMVQVMKDI